MTSADRIKCSGMISLGPDGGTWLLWFRSISIKNERTFKSKQRVIGSMENHAMKMNLQIEHILVDRRADRK